MECKHSEIRSEVREQTRSVSERSYGPYLASKNQLVAYFKGPTMEDTVGLSVSDYADVDVDVRDIFFIDALTIRDAEAAYALARVSPYLNCSTMIGRGERGIALYKSGTSQDTLDKACRYFRVIYGEPYFDTDMDGKSVFGTPDIGAYEY